MVFQIAVTPNYSPKAGQPNRYRLSQDYLALSDKDSMRLLQLAREPRSRPKESVPPPRKSRSVEAEEHEPPVQQYQPSLPKLRFLGEL